MRSFLHLCLLPVAQLLRLQAQQGSVCVEHCPSGLSCSCLALNRGLRVCEPTGFLAPPPAAQRWERQGLSCDVRLPQGARPMAPPPVVGLGAVVDPREEPELRTWAQEVGQGFYSQYFLVHHHDGTSLGVPILAGADVHREYLETVSSTLEHMLLRLVDQEVLANLSHVGVRFLIAGEESHGEDPWLKHPEVSRRFVTGLGGGAPWFPSTGVYEGESQVTVLEEMLHTIQYCALSPRRVCMYHKAYQQAMEQQLYTTDDSGSEVDGEPVPTLQADEYLAMAMHRWFGSGDGSEEYKVPGNTNASTGRQALRARDANAFCVLSTLFRADDAWNPEERRRPWDRWPNVAMDREEVKVLCEPVLEALGRGCPDSSTHWPTERPRLIP